MSARIPQDFLDHLLTRTDIVELIDNRVPLRKTGRNYTACCPFHNEKTPSFSVSPDKQFYHCFGCGVSGNAISFLMDFERLEFLDAVEELAQAAGLEIPRQVVASQQNQQQSSLSDIMMQADQFFRRQLRQHPLREKAIDYLRGRGLDGETVKAFGIGYAPPGWDNLLQNLTQNHCKAEDLLEAGLIIKRDNGGYYDRFRDRIMFPIQDRRGRTIAFGGRALEDDNPPKYLNSPETPLFHKSRELYGFYQAKISQRSLKRLLIVEGYMDVVALAQHGVTYAVATLGTATTTEHAEKLFRACKDIVFCFDGDRAGRQAAWRALENTLPLLSEGRQAGFLFLPDGEDPDSLINSQGREAFEQLLQQPLSLSDYLIQKLTEDNDISSLEGRANLIEQARPLLDKLPDSVFKDMLLLQLAEVAKLPPGKLVAKGTPANTPVSSSARTLSDQQVRRTPIRRAIALLLKEPTLAQKVENIHLIAHFDIPGMSLLAEIIEFFNEHPHLNLLQEKYRGTRNETVFAQLLNWQPVIPETLYEAEFLGVMQQVNQLAENYVFDKVRQGPLSDLTKEERELLQNSKKYSKQQFGQ